MQKTKLGITIGMLSAVVYFTALAGGYTPLFLLVGYILLFEQNDWLRRVCYKAVALTIAFSGAMMIVNLVPQAFGCLSNFLGIFNGYLPYGVISSIVSFITSVISLVETALFLLLALKAIKLQDVKVQKIDNFIDTL
ncbi:MAG: hypothetical protein IJC02_06915 [Lachnospiraceae bacterium]|nr:hypothetical protein [Lachnospiraceae bacterium]MBQ6993577.1 hypothetical protein [Lachnospiraceae bacterium]